MQTLILSDIHANQPALNAVLDHAYDHHPPTEVWFLGDMVGYGPDPYAVWKTLAGEPIPAGCALAGNHDWGLLNKLDGPTVFHIDAEHSYEISNYRKVAWEILRFHRTILQDKRDLLADLSARPVASNPRPGIYLTHGAFESSARSAVTRYTKLPVIDPAGLANHIHTITQNDPTAVYLTDSAPTTPQLFAFGHNHTPGLWRWQDNQWQPLDLSCTQTLGNLEEAPLCLNPGSVGFPRDGSGCPSYIAIDWHNRTLHFERVRYPVAITRQRMAQPPYQTLLAEPGVLIEANC